MLEPVNWNVQWATPKSRRSPVIINRIFEQTPEIVCITESYTHFLPDSGHLITSQPDCGYPLVAGRRKVILWSREPWEQIDAFGNETLPPGRFVRGVTQTSIGPLTILGICIPWQMAHVATGKRNRRPWEDHLSYLDGLARLIPDTINATIITGDFNQRIPNKRVPDRVYSRLVEVLCAKFDVLTRGEIAPLHKQTVDHIMHSRDLKGSQVAALSNYSESGQQLSDHFGVVADFVLG